MQGYSRRSLVGAAFGSASRRAATPGMHVIVKDQTDAAVEGAVVILSQHQTVKPPRSSGDDIPTVAAVGTTGKDGIADFPFGEVAQKRAIKGQRYTVEFRCHGFQPATRTGVIATAALVEVRLRLGFFVVY